MPFQIMLVGARAEQAAGSRQQAAGSRQQAAGRDRGRGRFEPATPDSVLCSSLRVP